MPSWSAQQLEILQRIAAYSVTLRAHQLGEWHNGECSANASCIRCSAEVRVHLSPIQPEVEGPALEHLCSLHAALEEAA